MFNQNGIGEVFGIPIKVISKGFRVSRIAFRVDRITFRVRWFFSKKSLVNFSYK